MSGSSYYYLHTGHPAVTEASFKLRSARGCWGDVGALSAPQYSPTLHLSPPLPAAGSYLDIALSCRMQLPFRGSQWPGTGWWRVIKFSLLPSIRDNFEGPASPGKAYRVSCAVLQFIVWVNVSFPAQLQAWASIDRSPKSEAGLCSQLLPAVCF